MAPLIQILIDTGGCLVHLNNSLSNAFGYISTQKENDEDSKNNNTFFHDLQE